MPSATLFSRDELVAAWERVSENDGCAGSDGVTVEAFARRFDFNLDHIRELLGNRRYIPFPLLQIIVEKRAPMVTGGPVNRQAPPPKTRMLLVPAVRDRILQTAAARQLSHSFEEEFLECSFAYRPGRGVDRAIARIRELQSQGFEFVVDTDLHAFFDEVDHKLLLEKLKKSGVPSPLLMAMIHDWIAGEWWDGHGLHRLTRGVPQGSPISPLLANYFLEDFDRELEASGQRLVRYADDFIILAKSAADSEKTLGRVKQLTAELHLTLNEEKTRVTSFADGFRFLGAYFHGYDVWTPWKTDRKPMRALFVAHPLPAAMRRRYERGVWKTAMEEALERVASPAADADEVAAGDRKVAQAVAFLYLTQQGSVLRKTGDRLLVEKDDQVLADLPYHKLDHILIFGNIQITTQAMGELLEKGVPVSLFSRQGSFHGALTPARGKNVVLRLKQFTAYGDSGRALGIARTVVRAKILNGASVIEQLKRHNPMKERASELEGRVAGIGGQLTALDSAATVEVLDGHEGTAARDYFAALMMFNKSGLGWPGRKQHPSEDPLNALLSLAYTLLMHEAAALLEGVGLDPYVGFLHQIDYGRPSLALDVIEPFRHPVADRLILRLVNKQAIGEEDFEKRDGHTGIFLKPAGLVRFFEFYEKWMTLRVGDQPGFRDSLKGACERMAVSLREGADYEPYEFRGEANEDWNLSSVTI